jgi:hypothetical protein
VAIFRLDFRPEYRASAKRLGTWLAGKLRSLAPRKDGATAGGGLPGEVLRLKTRFKVWGYSFPLASLGQKYLWLVRGTKRQQARPIDFDAALEAEARELAAAIEKKAAAQIERAESTDFGRAAAQAHAGLLVAMVLSLMGLCLCLAR